MKTDADNRQRIRQRLFFMLGASFAVLVIVLLWRTEMWNQQDREREAERADIGRRQAVLEKRLAKIETANREDMATLEEQVRRLADKQDRASSSNVPAGSADFALENAVPSIVELICIDNVDRDVVYTGSGTVVDEDGLIMTNRHLLSSADGTLIRFCGVGFTLDIGSPPRIEFVASPEALHDSTDLAILRIIERLDGEALPPSFPSVSLTESTLTAESLSLGDTIYIGGYPGVGAETFTFTEGVVSGRVGSDLIKTSALIDSGTSGGAAFDAGGRYVGVPTAAARGEIGGSLGYLIAAGVVDSFLNDYYAGLSRRPSEAE